MLRATPTPIPNCKMCKEVWTQMLHCHINNSRRSTTKLTHVCMSTMQTVTRGRDCRSFLPQRSIKRWCKWRHLLYVLQDCRSMQMYFFFMVLNNHTNTALNWIKGASNSIPVVTLGTPELVHDILLRWPDLFHLSYRSRTAMSSYVHETVICFQCICAFNWTFHSAQHNDRNFLWKVRG